MMKLIHRLFCGIALSVSLVMTGCGSGFPAGVSVKGMVTLDNKPLPSGTITFATPEGGAAAASEIVNGYYNLTQTASVSGINPGKYQVVIHSWKQAPGELLPDGSLTVGVPAIPQKYMNMKLSGLTAEVGESASSIDFELNSK